MEIVNHEFLLVEVKWLFLLPVDLMVDNSALGEIMVALHVLSVALAPFVLGVPLPSFLRPALPVGFDLLVRQGVLQLAEVMVLGVRRFPG